MRRRFLMIISSNEDAKNCLVHQLTRRRQSAATFHLLSCAVNVKVCVKQLASLPSYLTIPAVVTIMAVCPAATCSKIHQNTHSSRWFWNIHVNRFHRVNGQVMTHVLAAALRHFPQCACCLAKHWGILAPLLFHLLAFRSTTSLIHQCKAWRGPVGNG